MKTLLIIATLALSACFAGVPQPGVATMNYQDQDNTGMLDCLDSGVDIQACLCMEEANTDLEMFICTGEEY